jgi:hypothetical protein
MRKVERPFRVDNLRNTLADLNWLSDVVEEAKQLVLDTNVNEI